MAKGRTVAANEVTELDQQILNFCASISNLLLNFIDPSNRQIIKDEYGKVHTRSRDAGAGRGAGKWQRDAVTTRGTTSKTPISNRNLRWHPLVLANTAPAWATPIEKIEIITDDDFPLLIFHLKDAKGRNIAIPPAEVHLLEKRYVATTDDFRPLASTLKEWEDDDWTRNACAIKADEACHWQDSIETYALLGLSTLYSKFSYSSYEIFMEVNELLRSFSKDVPKFLLSDRFPKDIAEIKNCPICRNPLEDTLDRFRFSKRGLNWQPIWGSNKRSEGEDSSLQVMHVMPLIESEIRHNSSNVRYGHRWCNIAMTDHDLDETLAFMKEVISKHEG